MKKSTSSSSWQKLTPAGSSSSSLNSQSAYSQHSHNGEISIARMMSWPRNGLRSLVYIAMLTFGAVFCGFFISQRTMPLTENMKIKGASSLGQSAVFPKANLKDLLNKNRIPNIVHFIWCESSYFEYKHYVSVLSAIKFIQPDLIYFHLTHEPTPDPLGYNDWWQILRRDSQNLIINNVADEHHRANCSGNVQLAINIFNNHTRPLGGVYLVNGAVITSTLAMQLAPGIDSLSYSLPKTAPSSTLSRILPAVLLMRQNCNKIDSGSEQCNGLIEFEQAKVSKVACLIYDDAKAPILYPKNIWSATTKFAKLVRTVSYDTPDYLTPIPNPKTLVPLICHYLWLGGGTMDFLLYLSILSSLNILKADAVLVHGELEPTGELWQELKAMNNPRLSYVYRPQQITMYGTPVKKLSAMSDVLRTDILLKYGGIYTDWDAVWVKPLDKTIRSYEAVVAPDWPNKLHPFPATLNLGVMLAKPSSAYVKHLQEGMADYADGVGPLEWCFICLRAYKVLERYPQTARFEPHLQVMGYLGRYHPVWQPGSGDDLFDGKFNWKTDTYAVHWTFPTPKELRSKRGLVRANSTAADIARFILKKSGIEL